MPLFELGRAIQVKSHVLKFGSDWLSFSRVMASTNIFPRAETPYYCVGGGGGEVGGGGYI